MVGSDNAVLSMYDEEFVDDYFKTNFVETSKGVARPTSSQAYRDRTFSFQSCLVFLDTQMEKDIKLGAAYEYDPMNNGECMISELMA